MTVDIASFAFGFVSGMIGLVFILMALSLVVWKMVEAANAEPDERGNILSGTAEGGAAAEKRADSPPGA